MPSAPFIGVNHHLQSIFFGCALIRNESANTFSWLFETWMKAMYGRHPKSIITDHDPTMKKAIWEVFPTTIHRCCQCHVMRKAKEHFGVLYSTKDGFENDLKECINSSLSVEEFEDAWHSMLDKYELHENNHLQLLWNIRYQWIPVYFRDTFFANISTSQCSESMNAVAKIWLDTHTSIFKFVIQFEKITYNQYEREDLEDFMTKDGEPSLWSDDPIEKDARRIYTRNIFSEFKIQLRATTSYKLIELEKDSLYKISPISQSSTSRQRMCTYTMTIVRLENKVSCTCKLFEFYGLLCAHLLKVMHHIEIYNIPSRYILKRWTKNAKKGTPRNSVEMSGGSSFCRSRRFDSLTLEMQKFIFEGSKSHKAHETACQIIRQGVDTLTSINQIFEIEEATIKEPSSDVHRIVISQSSQVNMLTSECTSKDPPQSQCKGKKKPQRFKPPVEKKIKVRRTCKQCGKKGHNIRTCREIVDEVSPNDQICSERLEETDDEAT